ncbi:MAG TPA: hypothetical protein HPP56_05845 [Nitrospirae bacterium]|nr:hypothetical protein [Nitrospirota bacterium]
MLMRMIEYSNIPDSNMAAGNWMRRMGDKGKLKGLGIVIEGIENILLSPLANVF